VATRALIAPGCAQVIRPSPRACRGLATTLAMRARRRAGSTSALSASPQRIRACPVTPSCQLGPLPGTCSRGATVASAAVREAPDRTQSWLWNRASAPPSARLNQDYPTTTAAGAVRPGGRDASGRLGDQRRGPDPVGEAEPTQPAPAPPLGVQRRLLTCLCGPASGCVPSASSARRLGGRSPFCTARIPESRACTPCARASTGRRVDGGSPSRT
jgi:hypothetical protein